MSEFTFGKGFTLLEIWCPPIYFAFCGNLYGIPIDGCEFNSINDPLYTASSYEGIFTPLLFPNSGYTFEYRVFSFGAIRTLKCLKIIAIDFL